MNTLFRGSSLVTACIEEVMKLVGVDYIHSTLKACIDQVTNKLPFGITALQPIH